MKQMPFVNKLSTSLPPSFCLNVERVCNYVILCPLSKNLFIWLVVAMSIRLLMISNNSVNNNKSAVDCATIVTSLKNVDATYLIGM